MRSTEQMAPDSTTKPRTPPPYTVLICDDQPELREAISQLLTHSPHFVVAGEAVDGPSCLDQVRAIQPDVLILDVSMPGGGPEVARRSRLLNPAMHIMVFSGRADTATSRAMLDAGADQYVVKTGRLKPFLAAMDVAHHHLTRAS